MSVKGLIILLGCFVVASSLVFLAIAVLRKKKRLLCSILGVSAIVPIALSVLLMVLLHCHRYPLKYRRYIKAPDRESLFVLLEDTRFWHDPSWHVFKVSKNIDPKKYRVRANYMNLLEMENLHEKWKEKRVLYILPESKRNPGKANIHLLEDRYLILVRNGLYQGLYDIKQNHTFFDDTLPWSPCHITPEQLDMLKESKDYQLMNPKPGNKEWAEMALATRRCSIHQEIINILNKNKPNITSESRKEQK